MDATTQSALVAAGAALLGGIISGFAAIRVTHYTLRADLEREIQSRKMKDEARRKDWLRLRLEHAHKIVSSIGLEYSLSGMAISWGKKIPPQQFDDQYMASNEKISELWVIADAISESLGDEVKELRSEMNVFWGNFREMMRKVQNDEKVEDDSYCFKKSHEHAILISNHSGKIRGKIGERLRALNKINPQISS